MRRQGLHQLSAMDLSPLELIEAAAECGYDAVSLFTHAPQVPIEGQEGKFVFPTVTPELKRDVLARLGAHGLSVLNAEFFLIRPDVDLETYRPGLALGRELGAVNAVSHVFEPDRERAVDLIGRFCDIAAGEDMRVAIEFCPMTPGCKSMAEAAWFVEQTGRVNLGFGICPMHLVRSGGAAKDIAALSGGLPWYGQLNDGHGAHRADAYFDEVHDRQLPGDGDFPLRDIIAALPADAPVEFKCPSDSRRKAGVPALDWLREGYVRSRRLLDAPAGD